MTGYGCGECACNGCKITVEVSSVNRRQGEISLSLPRELEALDPRIRDEVHHRISRGRVNVRVVLSSAARGAPRRVRIDRELARQVAREYRKLAAELKLAPDFGLDAILRAPGVQQADDPPATGEDSWPAVHQSLKGALDQLVAMRAREGQHLARELGRQVRTLRRAAQRIQARVPAVTRRYRSQLIERVREAGLALTPGDRERLLREVVIFAERADITEELARLQSHFQQFDDCTQSTAAVGRTLDFLSQEMNREINTIGSKANDAQISRLVVDMKSELERFREQVQNVE